MPVPFKKFLQSLTEEELRDELHLLYKRFPQLREYYAVELSERPGEVLDKYKRKLRRAFFPTRGRGKRGRSQSRTILRDFRAINDRSRDLTELYFYRAELLAEYAVTHRRDSDAFLNSVTTAFTEACSLAHEHVLLDEFRPGAEALARKYNRPERLRRLSLWGVYREWFGG